MRRTGMFSAELSLALLLCVAGSSLWLAHARARDIGGTTDVLSYDAAQYAIAARELAEHGRLATPYALPVELSRHPDPPWPLALVQPGLVVSEAALLRLAGKTAPQRMSWVVLLVPFACYLAAGCVLALGTVAWIARSAADVSHADRWIAGLVVGMALLLDPEAQHYATGGFTELPFTLGLATAVAWLAVAGSPSPIGFGLLLGATGWFRGTILWLGPALAAALAAAAPPGRRARVFATCLAAGAVALLPWWIYKWRAFGTPAWDLSALSLWDGVGGRTWFSLNHLPEMPDVPHGGEALRALGAKFARNFPALLLEAGTGTRTLWIAGLVLGLFSRRTPTAPGRGGSRAVAGASLALLALGLGAAAITVPQLRYLVPTRVVMEAVGLVSVWAYLWTLPSEWASPRARRILCAGVAVVALGWGARQTARGMNEAARAARDRGVPSSTVLRNIASMLDHELKPGEIVMSNLGPSLAWYTRRPVLHLALTPADMESCRRRVDFQHVLVVFRDESRAWPGWDELVARPLEAPHRPDWGVRQVRMWAGAEGFQLIWLELQPMGPSLASRP